MAAMMFSRLPVQSRGVWLRTPAAILTNFMSVARVIQEVNPEYAFFREGAFFQEGIRK